MASTAVSGDNVITWNHLNSYGPKLLDSQLNCVNSRVSVCEKTVFHD